MPYVRGGGPVHAAVEAQLKPHLLDDWRGVFIRAAVEPVHVSLMSMIVDSHVRIEATSSHKQD
jgi:hypothetical protein